MLRDRRGTVMLELLAAFIVLIVVFVGITETALLVKDKIYLQRIARDGAREAAITGNLSLGYYKAQDRAHQYFGNENVYIRVDRQVWGNIEYITCRTEYPHKFQTILAEILPEREVTLNAQAVYGWYDKSTSYR